MLESLTIFTKGGLILYQYTASPSLVGASDGPSHTKQAINTTIIQNILCNPTTGNPCKDFTISGGLSFVWKQEASYIVVAIYPDILFEGPRQYLRQWATILVNRVVTEYSKLMQQQQEDGSLTENENNSFNTNPNAKAFDKVFKVLLEESKTQKSQQPKPPTQSDATTTSTSTKSAISSSGKEKRTWDDGMSTKVTEQTLQELDKSKKEETDESAKEQAEARALEEARQTYLPDEADLLEEDDQDTTTTPTWSSSVTGLFQQLTGNKILSGSDLDQPLKAMEDLLVSKNVAREIAHQLCDNVKTALVGKRLNSMYRVQTAVQQAMESTVQKILNNNQVDLLRAVLTKRGSSGGLTSSLFSKQSKRPYVITVMGINGIGKTTSLAKLAYYFQSHDCKPLLVAGDTFRSGAVEQLTVHAKCLNVDIYTQGYSKDPSSVAKAAIAQASDQGNDVVLIDTAGRMQNNVPLMKALGKLVQENRPDFCILVCEALVGHDGLSQYRMFQQAVSSGGRGIDGMILTKYDTVSDKVGAALTLTQETGAPIVFCGTGQKYHHLRKMNVNSVVNSLFS